MTVSDQYPKPGALYGSQKSGEFHDLKKLHQSPPTSTWCRTWSWSHDALLVTLLDGSLSINYLAKYITLVTESATPSSWLGEKGVWTSNRVRENICQRVDEFHGTNIHLNTTHGYGVDRSQRVDEFHGINIHLNTTHGSGVDGSQRVDEFHGTNIHLNTTHGSCIDGSQGVDEFHGINIHPHTTHGSGVDGSQGVDEFHGTNIHPHTPHMDLAWTEVKEWMNSMEPTSI